MHVLSLKIKHKLLLFMTHRYGKTINKYIQEWTAYII